MKVDSYIKLPGKNLPDDFMFHPEDYFVHIDDRNKILKLSNELDFDYIEGAIVLKHQDLMIIDFELWDLVGAFWAYLINALEDVIQNKEGHCYIPDQPIRIDMVTIDDHFLSLKIGNGKYGNFKLPREEFFKCLLDGGEHFFTAVEDYFSLNKFDFHIHQIQRLRELL